MEQADARTSSEIADNINRLLDRANPGEAIPPAPLQLRLIDATTAGQDATTLAKVAKLIAAMSPDGRRATICWLVAYFDYFGDTTE